MTNFQKPYSFHELEWDTAFFGVKSAKAVLNVPLNDADWSELKKNFSYYEFISINNMHSEPRNARLIAKDTRAYLTDINIQFEKNIAGISDVSGNVKILNCLEYDQTIIDMLEFRYSKFTEDEELAKRNGAMVYKEWIKNSFLKDNKYFVVHYENDGTISGYLLHSYKEKACILELMNVLTAFSGKGIASSLLKAAENSAHEKGCTILNVGTQLRNIGAINLYHRHGYRQVSSYQTYHFWNIEK